MEIGTLVDICSNIRKSFKPYFRSCTEETKFKANSEFDIFIKFLSSKEILGVKPTDVISLLKVATCANLLWARYIIITSIDHHTLRSLAHYCKVLGLEPIQKCQSCSNLTARLCEQPGHMVMPI